MPSTMPPLGVDPAALEPWILILETALPNEQNGYLVRLGRPDPDVDVVELGLLPLDGIHPAEFLEGFEAPREWLALGLVTRGWAAPMAGIRPSTHPARRRVLTTILLDRAGNAVGRTIGEDGDVVIDGPPPEGHMVDLLHQAMGLAGPRWAGCGRLWPVEGWTCPECGRRFGRSRQGHECAPAMSLEEYFATGPAHERPVFDAIMRHLAGVGPVHVEPVSVGIFLKNPRKFAELRPMERWVAVSFSLGRRASHRTIVRKMIRAGDTYWHVANVAGPDDLDGALGDLLTEAYELQR